MNEKVLKTLEYYKIIKMLENPAGNSLHAVCSLIHCFHHKCAFSSSYLSIPLFCVLFFLRC